MNFLVQHGKIRSQVINIPDGLPELLSDITREVLRCQPTKEGLCQFIIDYLHSLILAKEKAQMAMMGINQALRIVDEIIADMCLCDIPKIKADRMCEAMEDCFKRFLAQRRCDTERNNEFIKFNEVDVFDELIRKCKFSEVELKMSKPIIEAAYQRFVEAYMKAHENAEGTETLYQYFRNREEKRLEERKQQEAAIKIQSNFRGFLARRSLFAMKDSGKPIEESLESHIDIMEKDQAARKIQRFFRQQKNQKFKKDSFNDFEFQDVCEPKSNVSLSANAPPTTGDEPVLIGEHISLEENIIVQENTKEQNLDLEDDQQELNNLTEDGQNDLTE
ncbi:radial spoke binding protein 15 [Haematobia irritans]|uniref:radial spoke binding protein 15 n=1 Tax=Haematobia irritans TaxID=7368 RepID=UPI003F4F7798